MGLASANFAHELKYHPLACPECPDLDSLGPIMAFLGDLGLFPDRRSVFAGVPPYDRIDFSSFQAEMGPLIRSCSTSRVAVSVVDTISSEGCGGPWASVGHPKLYSLVIFSMPVQACPVLDPSGGRGDRLHVVGAQEGRNSVLRPRRSDHTVFLIKGILCLEPRGHRAPGPAPQL